MSDQAQVILALVALCATAIGGLVWVLKAQMRQGAAREIAWREFMGNDQQHHRQDMQQIAQFMGEQIAVMREIKEDLREMRNKGG